jgi:predicted AlkP superfamily phosphohydrolase/phosphomutase
VWRRRPGSFDELAQGIAWIETQLARLVEQAARADATGDWRLLTVRFDLLDSLGHRGWNLLGIDAAGGGPRAWTDKAREAFAALDRALADLLRLAERREAAVMLVSPYGLGCLEEKISPSEILRRRDLVRPGSAPLQALYCVDRWIEKLWRWPRRGVHRVVGSAFPQDPPAPCVLRLRKVAPFDWRCSRAMSFHGEMAAFVYLNTPDRFGQRLLRTRRQCDQAATEVLWALQEAEHPVTGQRLFSEAFLTAERYRDDPLVRLWPDIVAIPAAGFQTRPGLDRNGQLLRADPTLVATHRPGGLWMAAFPGAQPARAYSADLADVAPTVLRLLGLRRPPTMTGRAAESLLAPAGQS